MAIESIPPFSSSSPAGPPDISNLVLTYATTQLQDDFQAYEKSGATALPQLHGDLRMLNRISSSFPNSMGNKLTRITDQAIQYCEGGHPYNLTKNLIAQISAEATTLFHSTSSTQIMSIVCNALTAVNEKTLIEELNSRNLNQAQLTIYADELNSFAHCFSYTSKIYSYLTDAANAINSTNYPAGQNKALAENILSLVNQAVTLIQKNYA